MDIAFHVASSILAPAYTTARNNKLLTTKTALENLIMFYCPATQPLLNDNGMRVLSAALSCGAAYFDNNINKKNQNELIFSMKHKMSLMIGLHCLSMINNTVPISERQSCVFNTLFPNCNAFLLTNNYFLSHRFKIFAHKCYDYCCNISPDLTSLCIEYCYSIMQYVKTFSA